MTPVSQFVTYVRFSQLTECCTLNVLSGMECCTLGPSLSCQAVDRPCFDPSSNTPDPDSGLEARFSVAVLLLFILLSLLIVEHSGAAQQDLTSRNYGYKIRRDTDRSWCPTLARTPQ